MSKVSGNSIQQIFEVPLCVKHREERAAESYSPISNYLVRGGGKSGEFTINK